MSRGPTTSIDIKISRGIIIPLQGDPGLYESLRAKGREVNTCDESLKGKWLAQYGYPGIDDITVGRITKASPVKRNGFSSPPVTITWIESPSCIYVEKALVIKPNNSYVHIEGVRYQLPTNDIGFNVKVLEDENLTNQLEKYIV